MKNYSLVYDIKGNISKIIWYLITDIIARKLISVLHFSIGIFTPMLNNMILVTGIKDYVSFEFWLRQWNRKLVPPSQSTTFTFSQGHRRGRWLRKHRIKGSHRLSNLKTKIRNYGRACYSENRWTSNDFLPFYFRLDSAFFFVYE